MLNLDVNLQGCAMDLNVSLSIACGFAGSRDDPELQFVLLLVVVFNLPAFLGLIFGRSARTCGSRGRCARSG